MTPSHGIETPAPSGRLATPSPDVLDSRLAEWGAAGVGQSSWGPAVYGLVGSTAEAHELAARAAKLVGSGGRVFEGGFAGTGARVWRSEMARVPD